jgi:hypothetical protein
MKMAVVIDTTAIPIEIMILMHKVALRWWVLLPGLGTSASQSLRLNCSYATYNCLRAKYTPINPATTPGIPIPSAILSETSIEEEEVGVGVGVIEFEEEDDDELVTGDEGGAEREWIDPDVEVWESEVDDEDWLVESFVGKVEVEVVVGSASDMDNGPSVAEEESIVCDEGIGVMWTEV